MATIGIDIGGRTHVAARCRDGQARADREILRVSQDRAWFAVLDAWLDWQARDRIGAALGIDPGAQIAGDRVDATTAVTGGREQDVVNLTYPQVRNLGVSC